MLDTRTKLLVVTLRTDYVNLWCCQRNLVTVTNNNHLCLRFHHHSSPEMNARKCGRSVLCATRILEQAGFHQFHILPSAEPTASRCTSWQAEQIWWWTLAGRDKLHPDLVMALSLPASSASAVLFLFPSHSDTKLITTHWLSVLIKNINGTYFFNQECTNF